MSKTTYYQIRMDEDEKREAFKAFEEIGITPASAVRLFLRHVTATRALPFQVAHTPNARLRAVLDASLNGTAEYEEFGSPDELFAHLKK